ncbi:MAG: hypothetical protein WC365_02645 [Candidatus Babeliales bacterium]|jgi:hypothetical protein
MRVKTLNLLAGLTITIMTFSLYPMFDQNSMVTSPFDPLASFLDFDELMPPSLLDEDDRSQRESRPLQQSPQRVDTSPQTEEPQPQNNITSFEPYIPFLGGRYFFRLVDDLSSNIENLRVCSYDLWNFVQEKEYPLLKRLIISFKNLGKSNASLSTLCFNGNSICITNVAPLYRIPDVVLQKAHPLLTTLIRQLLTKELIRILLLTLNQDVVVCAACAKPIFKNNKGLSYFTSKNILLLKCLHFYHLGCANLKDEYQCPYCKIAIQSENDFVLYQQPI